MNNGGPAFPHVIRNNEDFVVEGMSLLDYYAGAALKGILAYSGQCPTFSTAEGSLKYYASVAFDHAEAMIAERKKRCGK